MDNSNKGRMLVIYNTDTTLNNWNGISFQDSNGSQTRAYIAAQNTDQATGVGAADLVFGTRFPGAGITGVERMRITTSGNVGIGTTAPTERLDVVGNIKASGTVSQGSSREFKKNIAYISAKEAVETLNGLNPVRFEYKGDDSGDEHLGFIAEEVPEMVADKDRKHLNPMDLTAVFAKVIQEQQKILETQQETINALKKEMQMMKSAMNFSIKGL